MQVKKPPTRFVDKKDGNPIEQFKPQGSRYEVIEIKRTDDGVHIKTQEAGTDKVDEFIASLTDQMYRGVSPDDGTRRRDIDDDVLDALHQAGYVTIDQSVKRY